MKVIITGVTGMVGEGVLHQCIQNKKVSDILIIGRKPSGQIHSKIKELVHENMYDFSSIEAQLVGYDACFFCLGTTSLGKTDEEFYKITHGITLAFANTFLKASPNSKFFYVSGTGTDSTETKKGWAKIKGKVENDLLKLGFKEAYMYRPGYLHPIKGLKLAHKYYSYIGWMFPFFNAVFPAFVSKLSDLGDSMINIAENGHAKNILEVKDINKTA